MEGCQLQIGRTGQSDSDIATEGIENYDLPLQQRHSFRIERVSNFVPWYANEDAGNIS